MSHAMIQAAVTMNQLQNKLDIVGNNLANSETTGYKNQQADFASLLFQQIDNMSDPANTGNRLTPDGVRVGSGAKLGSVKSDLTPGSISETDRVLDTALLGDNHLFQIQVTENGATETRYTRDGAFYLNPTNNDQAVMLTTKDGLPVIGENGPIVIAAGFDAIDIQSDGDINVKRGDQTERAGNIAVVEATRPQSLEATGQSNFRLPDGLEFNMEAIMQAVPANTNVLKSSALEQSNVDISKQMTDMMMAQRSYQFNARTISMGDQMSGLINQLR